MKLSSLVFCTRGIYSAVWIVFFWGGKGRLGGQTHSFFKQHLQPAGGTSCFFLIQAVSTSSVIHSGMILKDSNRSILTAAADRL